MGRTNSKPPVSSGSSNRDHRAHQRDAHIERRKLGHVSQNGFHLLFDLLRCLAISNFHIKRRRRKTLLHCSVQFLATSSPPESRGHRKGKIRKQIRPRLRFQNNLRLFQVDFLQAVFREQSSRMKFTLQRLSLDSFGNFLSFSQFSCELKLVRLWFAT